MAKVLASGTAMAIAMVMRIALIGLTREGATLVWDPVPRKRGRTSMWIRVQAVVIDARTEIPSVNGFGRS
ncbi:MAG: hypothetical protein H0U18_08055 [Pyrinomonadaceae bacterium]|nr:hypothetical protein [Pyrinomonadaceae bacterium]